MIVYRKTKGFTLVEMVVVVGIMAFLSTIIYSSFEGSRAKSRDQKRVSDISSIQLALEQYFQKNGVYPTTLQKLLEIPSGSMRPYINELPKKALPTDKPYEESYFPITKVSLSSNCISYQLWTKFEKNNSYIGTKRGFNSNSLPLPDGMFECGTSHNKIDASADLLIYDVMP